MARAQRTSSTPRSWTRASRPWSPTESTLAEFAPGEPEAPVSAPQASPGAGAPDGAPATPDNPACPSPSRRPRTCRPAQSRCRPGPSRLRRTRSSDDLEQITAKGQEGRRVPRAGAADQGRLRELPQARGARGRGRAGARRRQARQGAAARSRQPRPRARGRPSATPTTAHSTLVSGIKLVHADVIAALSRAGIERFEPRASSSTPSATRRSRSSRSRARRPGTIVEVYQRGYVLGDFVIRPARVVVAA